jgi:hypothetical protein
LTALKRSRTNHRTWWIRWRQITSSSASDHGNPAGVAVSMQKGIISMGMETNRNFGKWLSYFRGISRIFCSTSYSCHMCQFVKTLHSHGNCVRTT